MVEGASLWEQVFRILEVAIVPAMKMSHDAISSGSPSHDGCCSGTETERTKLSFPSRLEGLSCCQSHSESQGAGSSGQAKSLSVIPGQRGLQGWKAECDSPVF